MEEQIRAYQKILKSKPLDIPAFTALEELYQGADRWAQLLELYENRLHHLTDEAEETALRLKAAQIAAMRLADQQRALAYYQRVLQSDADNRSALEGLAALYRKAGNWTALAAVMERQASLTADSAERAELYEQLAQVYLERLKKPESALVALRYAAAAAPERSGVLERIFEIEISRGAFRGAWQALAALKKSGRIAAPELGQRYLQLGQALLQEPMLHDICRQALEEAAGLLADPTPARKSLEQLEQILSDRLAYIKKLRVEAVESPDKGRAVALYLQIAKHFHLLGGHDKEVEDNLAKCNLLQPGNIRVLEFMERYYLSARRPKDLVDRLEEVISRVRDPQVVVPLLERQAMHLMVHLQDVKAALEVNKRILQLQPAHPAATFSLIEAYQEAGRWPEVVELLKMRAEQLSDRTEKAAVVLEIARLLAQQMKDGEGARFQYEEVLRLEPDNLQAATQLADYYAKCGEWDGLARCLEIILGRTRDVKERIKLLERLAEIHLEKRQDALEAFRAKERILYLDPGRKKVISELQELAERTGRYQDLVAALQTVVAAGQLKGKALLGALETIGAVCSERLQRPDDAIRAYQQILELEPKNLKALDALAKLQVSTGGSLELVEIYTKQLDLVRSSEKKKELLFKLAAIWRDRMADFARAAGALEQVLQIDARDGAALKQLADLEERESHWQRAAEAWNRLLGAGLPAAEAAEVKLRLALIYEQRLNDPEQALRLASEVLAGGQAEEEVARGAVAVLERLQERGVSALRVAEILQPFYALVGDWRRHVDMLELRLEACSAPGERLKLLENIAEVYENRLLQKDMAFFTWGRALKLDPQREDLHQRVRQLAAAIGRASDLAALYEELLQEELADAWKLEVLVSLGQLYASQLNRPRQAIRCLRQALEIDPRRQSTRRQLIELLRQTSAWSEFVEEAPRLLEEGLNEAEQRELMLELARVFNAQLHDRPRAIAWLRLLCEKAPRDLEALRELEVLLEANGDWSELAEVLEAEIALVPAQQVKEIRLRLAQVRAERTEQRQFAVEHYQQVLAENPDDARAIAGLESLLGQPESAQAAAKVLAPLYQQRKDWGGLARALQVMADHAGDAAARVELLVQLAQLLQEKLQQPEKAFATLRQAFVVLPGREDLFAALEKLAASLSAYDLLAASLEDAVAAWEGHPARLSALQKLALIYRDQLHRSDLCASALRRLLELDENNGQALSWLENIYRENKAMADLAWVLERQAALAPQSERRWELMLQAAKVREEHLGDIDGAIAIYQNLWRENSQDIQLAKQLERLYQASGRWREQAELLPQLSQLSRDTMAVVDYQRKLAQIYIERLDDLLAGVGILAQVLQVKPGHPETVADLEKLLRDDRSRQAAAEALEGVYRNAGEWRKLAAVLEMRLAALGDPARRLEVYANLRELYEEKMGEKALAFGAAARALKEQPQDQGVLQILLRLGQEAGLFEELTALLLDVADQHTGTELALQLRKKVAEIYETHLGRRNDAMLLWEQLYQAAPVDLEVLAALERFYREEGRFQQLVQVYRAQLELVNDLQQRKDLLFRTAACLAEGLEDVEGAILTYQSILEQDPTDRRALKLLEVLLESHGRWPELGQVLEQQLALLAALPVMPAEEMRELLLRKARLHLEKLNSHRDGLLALAEVLRLFPDDAEAVDYLEGLLKEASLRLAASEILEPVYRRREDYRKLVGLLEARLGVQDKPDERLEIYRQLLQIYGEQMGQKTMSFTVACRALREFPQDEGVRQQLEQLAEQTGSFEELAVVYEEVEPALRGTPAGSEVARRLAQLKETYLQDKDDAVSHWRMVLAGDPDDREALAALERLYRERGAVAELVGVLRHLASLEQGLERRKDLLHEVASLLEERLGRPEETVEVYREILAIDPQDLTVLKLLDRMLEKAGRYEELCQVMEQELAAVSEKEAPALELRLGDLERRLRHPDKALAHYRRVLEKEPGQRAVVERLLDMFQAGEARSELFEILPPALEQVGAWQHLIAVLEVMSRQEDEQQARQVLRRLAEVYEKNLNQQELAFTTWGRLMLLDPADEETRLQLERLAAAIQAWDMLAELYSQALEKCAQPSLQLVFHRRLAGLFNHRLADEERARLHLEQVVSLDSSDTVALQTLEKAYRRLSRYDRLLEVLKRRARLAASGEQNRLWREVAELYLQLGDRGGAIEALREALGVMNDDLESLQKLEKLCQEQGRYKDLAEVLAKQVQLYQTRAEVAELQKARFRLAVLLEQEFKAPDKALEIFRQILADDARQPETLGYLETALVEGRLPGVDTLLEEAYQKSGEWKKYIELLEAQVRSSRIMARRLELLGKIAQLQEEKLGLKALAFNTTLRMFHEDMTNAEVRKRLERLAEEDENLDALAAVYEEELDSVEEPTVGLALSMKLADIYTNHLPDDGQAVRFLRQALRFDPYHGPALVLLSGLLEKRGAWEELAEVLSRRLELAKEPAELTPLLYQLGEVIYARLQQAGKAVGYFRKLLELSPGHLPSLNMLEKIFEELGEAESLYEVLQAKLQQVKGAKERLDVVSRLSALASRLGRADEAISLWQSLLQENAGLEPAWDALDKLYEESGRWAELADHLEKRMTRTTDPEKLASLSGRLGWVKSEKLGQHEEAKRHFMEVLRLDPKDLGALRALREIFRSSGEWEELVKILRRLVQLQEDMQGVKQIRFELAEVLGDKLNRRMEAIEAAKRAADIEPHTAQDLERLAAIFRSCAAWQEAVNTMEQLVELRDSDAEKIDLLLQIAAIWRDNIQRPLGAAAVYEKVLDIEPLQEDAFRAAELIYRENKEWRRLTQLLEKRLGGIRERRDRLAMTKEIAAIYEERLAQKELAFTRYCAAFREDFTDDEVLAKLERLAEETQDYDTLLAVLEDAVSELPSGSRAVGLLRKMAAIHHRLGNSQEAENLWRRAAEQDPRERQSLENLAALLEEQQRWDDLLVALEKIYERCDELTERKEVRTRIARLQEEKLNRPELAIESYRRILELDGRDQSAIDALVRLFQQTQRWRDLIFILQRAADQSEDSATRVGYLFRVAAIWESELGDDEQAIEAYRRVLEADPKHLESVLALERIYTKLDRWHELLGVFEIEVDLVPERDDKIKIHHKMASIWEERFADLQKAISCHEKILQLDPGNLAALKALERLVSHQGDYPRLIDLYQRHLELAQGAEKVEIYLAMGEVWHMELSRVDKAEEAFGQALKIDPKSRPAMHALGQLYEKSGNWFNALEMLRGEAELCGAGPEAVDLYYRMGKINEDMLLDSQAARAAYSRALEIDPAYLPAIKALKLIYYLEKDYERYLEMMIQEAEHTEDNEEKTRLFYEIGKFLQEQYEDSGRAAEYYQEALTRTPDFLPAAKPLADIYFRTEQWDKAEAVMEVVVNGLDRNKEARELCRQHYRLGYITEKLNKADKALEHYRQSYELDPTYLPALEGLGNALIRAEKWEEAFRIYQTILIHHRDGLADAEVAELYWQLGDINFHMTKIDQAIANFRKALEIDDTHLASMQYLWRIYEEQGAWEEAYDVGMKMSEALGEEELFDHFLRLGDMCRDKLQDLFRAVDAYQGALRYRPDSLDLLTRLLEVYRNTRQFPKAVEVLESIVKVEGRPSKLVEYHELAGDLLVKEVHDDIKAVEHYNAALDLDPSQTGRIFTKIVDVLRRRKEWQQLKENYIRMIKRLPVEARKVKLVLWKDLGELCRVVLRNLAEAQDAYRMVCALDPDNVDNLAVLAELLAARESTMPEAISTHHKILTMSPNRVDSYRTLWKLYNARKEYDKVYVMASILRYLKKADDEEKKIVNFFTQKAPEVAARPVTDNMWEAALAHPAVKVPFTKLFAVLYTKAPAMFIKEHREVNLRKGTAIDLARDRSLFVHNFRVASKVLGGMNVELYALKDQAAPNSIGMIIAPTMPTALIAYQEAFRIDNKKHLLFQIGRQLAASRPQFLLACIMSLKDLDILLQAACSLFSSSYQVTDPAVDSVRNKLRRALSETGKGMLEHAVREYLAAAKNLSLKQWVEGVEHSINRAGFVVCNDVSAALGILTNETAWLTPMRSIQKVRELLVFASSAEYLGLREKLGLAVSV